ncbi:MAG: hypothetical protein PHF21_03095 [Bacilli bacterium]|nr:hypothetical protein [Bacilli bacterium]
MKKSRLLALTLVVAVMLVGAGYAYWSEALTITSTVNTGELDVMFVEPADINGDQTKYQPNADCTPALDGHSMKITFLRVYPGLKNDFEFTLTNTGTLGAFVDDFKIDEHNFLNINLIRCNSIMFADNDGAFIEDTNFTGGSYAQALAYLNGLNDGNGVFVDTLRTDNTYEAQSKKIKFAMEFSPKLTEKNFVEDVTYFLNVNANVHQFNGR